MKRSVFVTRVDSQLTFSQRDKNTSCTLVNEPEQDKTRVAKLRRGIKRPASEKTELVIKVELPNVCNESTRKKNKAMAPRWVLEPTIYPSQKTRSQREDSQRSIHDCVRKKDVYNFSQDNQPKGEKEKVQTGVLRNITRMLAENNHIRQRLVSLSQVNHRDNS